MDKTLNFKNIPVYLYLASSIAIFISYIIIAKKKNILPSYTILIITAIIILCIASNVQFLATSTHPTLNIVSWILVFGYIGVNSYGLYKLNLETPETKQEESKQ